MVRGLAFVRSAQAKAFPPRPSYQMGFADLKKFSGALAALSHA
jgi:hypothetical protein